MWVLQHTLSYQELDIWSVGLGRNLIVGDMRPYELDWDMLLMTMIPS